MAINHKIDYTTIKRYCKYSLLYEAVMGRTKNLNEVTKSLKSPTLSLHAAGKQRKDIASHVAATRPLSPVSSMLLLWKAGSMWETEDHPTRWQTALPDCQDRHMVSREPPNSPKSGVVLWSEKSLLQLPFVTSERWASVAANLQQNPWLAASRS